MPADTDSIILAMHHDNLLESRRPDVSEELFLSEASKIFEDPTSDSQQSGLFKLEGLYEYARIRCSKAYELKNLSASGGDIDRVVRMKGVPRKNQELLLRKEHFGQDPRTNTEVVRSFSMAPTLATQVVMSYQSRTMGHSLNVKRKFTVHNYTKNKT